MELKAIILRFGHPMRPLSLLLEILIIGMIPSTFFLVQNFIPGITSEVLYKFLIVSASGQKIFKADPYGTYAEVRPHTASITFDPDVYVWEDDAWMKRRASLKFLHSPLNIFEVHLGSWKQHTDPTAQEEDSAGAEAAEQAEEPKDYFDTNVDAFYTYDELSEELVAYVKEMGYTHIERWILGLSGNGLFCSHLKVWQSCPVQTLY